jgi:hypothetical protein
MREEQFDHIENRIREAAENSHPGFEEAAWEKMEALLDADKKRRPFGWLWALAPLLLLLVTGAGYLIATYKSSKDVNLQTAKSNTATSLQKTTVPSVAVDTILAGTEKATNDVNKTKKINGIGTLVPAVNNNSQPRLSKQHDNTIYKPSKSYFYSKKNSLFKKRKNYIICKW